MSFNIFQIKRRIVITLIITLFIIFATNKLWLKFSPVSVDFDVEGKGNYTVEVQLNKKNNNEFRKIKSEEIDVNFDKEKHVNIDIPRSKMPKRIQIIFSRIGEKEPLKITNIQLGKGKLKLNDLNKFTVNTGKLEIQGNSLILYPDNENTSINLLYNDRLKFITDINTDYNLLIIISVLTFLLFYKLSNYVADFNTVEKHSRIEIIFLSVFFVSLFLPMSHVNTDEISTRENRALARWQPLFIKDEGVNLGFGRAFDNWFNDRFLMRDSFIAIHDKKYLLSKNWRTQKVVKGKDGWLFLGTKDAIDSYTNSILFSQDELKKIADYLNSINDYCEKNGKKFYFIVAPDKAKVYNEYYTDLIKPQGKISRVDQLSEYLQANSKVKLIYPLEELQKQKEKEYVYFKQDTHWGFYGAYFAYLQLMNDMKKDFEDIPIYKINNYDYVEFSGDLNAMLPDVLKVETDTKYITPVFDNTNFNCTKPIQEKDVVNCVNENQTKNLLVFRDSFSNSLIPYLGSSFKNSMFVWQYKFVPSLMKDADVIILEIAEITLPELMELKLEEN